MIAATTTLENLLLLSPKDRYVMSPPGKEEKSVRFSESVGAMSSISESIPTTTAQTSLDTSSEMSSEKIGHSEPTTNTDQGVDEVTDMFKGLAKKKSKKPKDKVVAADGDEPSTAAGGEFDATQKKKKKKTTKAADAEDFDAKLAEAGVNEDGQEENGAVTVPQTEEGDPLEGTGIWQHDASQDIGYSSLLSRFYRLLDQDHPDMLSGGSKSYKIPPPQCLREGNKKTIFANIADICKRMKRTDEHVTSFLFAELGTSGSVDGSRRLVIKGRFQQKQIVRTTTNTDISPIAKFLQENVLRRYIVEYVSCKVCVLSVL